MLYDKKISNVREFLPVPEGVAKVCAVKAPGLGDRRKAMLERHPSPTRSLHGRSLSVRVCQKGV